MSWRHADDQPAGRSTIWIQPAIEMRFVFGAAESEKLDQALLQRYANDASSTAGLVIDLNQAPAVPVTAPTALPARRQRTLQSA
jgi:hypothetical protein